MTLMKNRLEVYRRPDAEEGRYLELTTLGEGEKVMLVGLEEGQVAWWE
jgi:hypothetical protein